MSARGLPWTVPIPTSALVAQAVFFLQCGWADTQTDRITHAADNYTHVVAAAGVGRLIKMYNDDIIILNR